LQVGLLCLSKTHLTFCFGFEFIGAAHSHIADQTAAPLSAVMGKS
jgi:hypothetical protein